MEILKKKKLYVDEMKNKFCPNKKCKNG